MELTEAFQKIWARIDNPHSMCPDVEIGYVRQVLAEVLAEALSQDPTLTQEVDRFVLGSILVAPITDSELSGTWRDSKHVYTETPRPEDGDHNSPAYVEILEAYFEADSQEHQLRSREVKEALGRLEQVGLVLLKEDPDGGPTKFHAVL
jgi:hypothetical protein